MTAVKCLNLRAVYRQQEYISLMCLSEADTGGHPSRTGLGCASPCALLCCISPQRGSISKENMALGWQTVWSGGPLGRDTARGEHRTRRFESPPTRGYVRVSPLYSLIYRVAKSALGVDNASTTRNGR